MKSVLLVFVAFENNFPNLKGKKENVRKNFCKFVSINNMIHEKSILGSRHK